MNCYLTLKYIIYFIQLNIRIALKVDYINLVLQLEIIHKLQSHAVFYMIQFVLDGHLYLDINVYKIYAMPGQ